MAALQPAPAPLAKGLHLGSPTILLPGCLVSRNGGILGVTCLWLGKYGGSVTEMTQDRISGETHFRPRNHHVQHPVFPRKP